MGEKIKPEDLRCENCAFGKLIKKGHVFCGIDMKEHTVKWWCGSIILKKRLK